MNEATAFPATPQFKDRRTGLMAFGFLEILLGGLRALMVPLMIFGQMLSASTTRVPLDTRMIVAPILIYGLMAVAFVWWSAGMMLPILGYLLWVKKFFQPPAEVHGLGANSIAN